MVEPKSGYRSDIAQKYGIKGNSWCWFSNVSIAVLLLTGGKRCGKRALADLKTLVPQMHVSDFNSGLHDDSTPKGITLGWD